MPVVFPQGPTLVNLTPDRTALNPKELDYFTFYHFAIPLPLTCITGYTLSGDVPAGLSVDSSGTISGEVKHFGEQPSCTANKPDQIPDEDGANWNNNGRFRPETYTFMFNITCHYLDPFYPPKGGPIPCVKPGSLTWPCILTMCKDHDIDNKIWKDNYSYPLGDKADPRPLKSI
jgi:hypothetical protein